MTTAAYRAVTVELHDRLGRTQAEPIQQATAVGRALAADGVLHLFGRRHSHMLAEDLFCRAGALAAVDALLDPNLTIFGMVDPDPLERTEGHAGLLAGGADLQPGEVVVVASSSGINPVPSERPHRARPAGIQVAAVTSATANAGVPGRHSNGLRLTDVADIVIDTGGPRGDAGPPLAPGEEADDVHPGAESTVVGAAALNGVALEAVSWMAAEGHESPVLASPNSAGDGDRNLRLAGQDRHRIPHLRIA